MKILALMLMLFLVGCASSGGMIVRSTPQERAAFDRANPDLAPKPKTAR